MANGNELRQKSEEQFLIYRKRGQIGRFWNTETEPRSEERASPSSSELGSVNKKSVFCPFVVFSPSTSSRFR